MWKAYTSVIFKPVLHDFAGKPFEGLCREWMWRECCWTVATLPCACGWPLWDRQDEIDVMAVDNV